MWISDTKWEEMCGHVRDLQSKVDALTPRVDSLQESVRMTPIPKSDFASIISYTLNAWYDGPKEKAVTVGEAVRALMEHCGVSVVRTPDTPGAVRVQPAAKPKRK